MRLTNQLMERGMSNPEAEQQALEFPIPANGPEFGDDPPEPLSYEDQKKVTDLLDNREEFRQKLRAKNPPTLTRTWSYLKTTSGYPLAKSGLKKRPQRGHSSR
jgi:hypothetical protein